jgi:hypothetical protein
MDTRETLVDPHPSPGSTLRRRPHIPKSEVARLVKLRLEARVAEVREQLDEASARRQAPDQLVSLFGATVAEAQRALDRDRAVAERLSAALVRAADEQGREMIGQAEAESRLLRSLAAGLRQAPTGSRVGLASPDRRPVDEAVVPTTPLQARAS